MNEDSVRREIEVAFACTPSPDGFQRDISRTEADEGVADYFLGTTWRNHTVKQLRHHDCALIFFTDQAFRYWLPAFMLAELEDPNIADTIKEFIVERLRDPESDTMLRSFTKEERMAVITFLKWCSERYVNFPVGDALARVRGTLME